MTTDAPLPNAHATTPFRLPGLAVVDATGADAATFLQGQLTNDVLGAGAGRACLAGYCSPKGRLLALPLVLALPDGGLRLLLPRELLDGLLQRLRLFVMRAAVTFTVREDLHGLGLHVPEGERDTALATLVPGCPDTAAFESLEVMNGDGAVAQVCRWHDAFLPGRVLRYLIVATDAVPARAEEGGDALWRLGDITAGVPRIGEATREAFVPQMVNLQLVDGLSFRKGCYPGQEIVARMQYLGKLKRHMRRFVAADPAPGATDGADGIAAGTTLSADGDADAGRVVDAVRTNEGTELLAVVKIGADTDALRADGLALEPRPLPYALPASDPEAVADPAADPAADPGPASRPATTAESDR